ncbi:hypothetical protein FHS95_002554 [Sphingomonas naasensis]|uniref:Uncharacterized protein n=1 Tax=Sphingomonas naasensis TaxID=1344951 RepID=A0A4S1WMR3_9SPHN|nr:hypothetical protein [Sphingomonas naasensis]NIJ20862.1 hypothetical protein [Sphingomonas naasensis]TGX43257.1 hypothetical protein E5A74_08810 [Sphingomonas naasensis]
MKKRNALALLALGALAATPASASDKQDFERCDGRVHPGKQNDGMRGEASQPYSFFGRAGAAPLGVIAACTRALASPRLLPTQTLRKAHLLRARAAARLETGDAAAAIADLDLAINAAGGLAADRFYQRSMGVSLDLLRALALAQSGDLAGAVPLANRAGAARPWSLDVQRVTATVLQAARPVGSASTSPWLTTARLSPRSAGIALMKEAEIGNFAGVVALAPAVKFDWPVAPLASAAFAIRDVGSQALIIGAIMKLDIAYARAATGDVAGARGELAELQRHVAAARPAPSPQGAATLSFGGMSWEGLDRYLETRQRQVEARIAVAEARVPDAIARLVGNPMPQDAATIELLGALKLAVPAKDGALVPDAASYSKRLADNRQKTLTEAVSSALLAPETPRAVVDYERARPNILGALVGGALTFGTSLLGGIDRTDGFRTRANPDGTTKVEFIGNTPSSALVQEMTLLRAAEVTRAAGKPAFVIVARSDYTRRLQTSRGGMPISSTAQGYKTELTIRPVDAGVEAGQALDAIAIIDALGPLYYEEKPKTAARTR